MKMATMKNICFYLCFLAITSLAYGQNRNDSGRYDEQFEASKIAFMTSRMDLSPSEAKSFWPIYNAYEKAKNELRHSMKRYSSNEIKEMSNKEIEAFLVDVINYDEMKLKLKKELIKNMQSILPKKKTAMLFVVEGEFRKELIYKMKERR